MVRIHGAVSIDAPVEEVFDLVADERNEPTYNPRIVRAEKVSVGPVGRGTTFVAEPKGAGRLGEMTVELLEYDRPRRLHTFVRSSYFEVDGVLSFVAADGGTLLRWDWDMRLVGPLRVLTPVLRLVGPRWERRNWLDLKEHLESARRRRDAATDGVLEVHLEELGQHSWWKAALSTLGGTYGSAQFRFVARPPGPDDRSTEGHLLGATFPVMRAQDLDDLTVPNAWVDIAHDRLDELDRQLVREGWHRTGADGGHWWSRSYVHPGADAPGRS